MKTNTPRAEKMATRDKKQQIRVAPELAKALSIIAKAKDMPNYLAAEIALRDWIREKAPEIYQELKQSLALANIPELPPNHHAQHEPEEQGDDPFCGCDSSK
jgi:predicted transcriptional regulator